MNKSIHQLKITLTGARPPIWRRVQVPSDISLRDLHDVFQTAMGWFDGHLHQFDVGGVQYGEPSPEAWMPLRDERRMALRRIAPRVGVAFTYEYDFGDSWTHHVVVEKIIPAEEGRAYPRCLAGRRACPPEDCGGVWGYEELLAALADPGHPEHDEYLDWLGGSFDPATFDLQVVNARLEQSAAFAQP